MVVAVALLAPTVAAAATTTDEGPTGLSTFEALLADAGYEVRDTLTTPAIMDPPDGRTLLVVVGPQMPYSSSERRAIHEFVARGGRLLVADDLGPGGDIGAEFGIQFDRVRVFSRSGGGPTADLVAGTGTVGHREFQVLFDRPSSLTSHERAYEHLQLLASTGPGSFADLDDDGTIGVADIQGPLDAGYISTNPDGQPVAAFLGDTGILRNDLIGSAQNEAFVEAIVRTLLPDGGVVVLDHSRDLSPAQRLLAAPTAALVVVTTLGPYRWGTAIAAAAVLALGLRTLRGSDDWSSHRFEADRVCPRKPAVRSEDRGPDATGVARTGVDVPRRAGTGRNTGEVRR